jgi:RNA polymerase sigma-70 factor, ECF subfamily
MEQLLDAGAVIATDGPMTRLRSTPAAGANEALIRLYAEHGRALLAYVQRFTNDRGRAEDVAQETFVRAWRALPGLLDDGRPVRPWLYLVARRLLVDSVRAARTRPALTQAEPTVEGTVDGGFDQLLDHTILLEAMQRLSEPHRRILVETFFAGHPVTVTAARLGVPPGTARSRLHYALSRLREQLGPHVMA